MSETMKNALIKLHIAVFLWGFTGVLGRLISLNEGLLVWYRMFFAVIGLFALMYWRGQLHRVDPKTKWQLFGTGGLIALHWCFFFGSIKYSNVSIALTVFSSSGFFTAILEPVMMRRRIILNEVLLGLLAIAGIYLIFHFDPQYKLGILLGLIATVLSTIFSILNKQQVAYVGPRILMLYELGGGLMILTILMPFYLMAFPPARLLPSPLDYIWLLILSLLCTILAMDLSLQALKKVSAFTQNLTFNLEPIYGIILAFLIYQENQHLSDGFYIGFSLILLAVVLQTFRIVKSAKKEPHVFGV